MPRFDHPLDQYVDSQHPLLRKALDAANPTYGTMIEFLIEGKLRTNYTQIVRTPYVGGEREQWRAFERHLDAIESTLWDGVPERTLTGGHPWMTCGGVRHYHGRDPLRADTIRFRPLQDCVMFTEHGRQPGEAEFLTEFSLEVIPAPAIKRRA